MWYLVIVKFGLFKGIPVSLFVAQQSPNEAAHKRQFDFVQKFHIGRHKNVRIMMIQLDLVLQDLLTLETKLYPNQNQSRKVNKHALHARGNSLYVKFVKNGVSMINLNSGGFN